MDHQETDKKNSGNRIFIYLTIALTALSAFLGYKLYNQKEIIKTQYVEIEKKSSDMDLLKQELNDAKLDIEKASTDNKQLQSQLDQEREKIEELETQLEKAKGNAAEVNRLRRELTTIRNLIKSYLRQIDSLNTANQTLQAENATVRKDLESEKNVSKQLNEEKAALNQQIEKGSKLTTFNIFADGINERGSNKESSTTRARRADKIRCCFNLAANNIAKAGERMIYMKVIGPDGKVFSDGSDAGTITVSGQVQQYTAKKNVNYSNKSTEVCMIFRKKEDFMPGKYQIEIFAEEVVIGNTSLELK